MAAIPQELPHFLSLVERGDLRDRLPQPPLPENPEMKLMNTRLWMMQLSEKYGRPITLGTIPDFELDEIAKHNNAVWCMGIFEESERSTEHNKYWSKNFAPHIPGFDKEKHAVASPYALVSDNINPRIAQGGWPEWDFFRDRMHARGVQVGLDFVPNHVAADHPWTRTRPDFLIQGTDADIDRYGMQFFRARQDDGSYRVYAHGKDPNQGEWHDTAQLNYANPALQDAQIERLRFLADHADIIRCDVAMLVNKDTYRKTWGWRMWQGDHEVMEQMEEFWVRANRLLKADAASKGRSITLIAEAYWDKEELGRSFDYIYDKTLYDRMHAVAQGNMHSETLMDHMKYLYNNESTYQGVNFNENQDEPRADEAFGDHGSKAATVVARLGAGMYMSNHGQENGGVFKPPLTTIKIPPVEFRPDKQELEDRITMMLRSDLGRKGKRDVHYLKTEDGNVADLVGQQITEEKRGVIVCTNLKNKDTSGRVYIPRGARYWVYDLMTGLDIFEPNLYPNGSTITVPAGGSKAIYYEYPHGVPTETL